MDPDNTTEPEIIAPLAGPEAAALPALIRRKTQAAIETGRLELRSFPDVDTLSSDVILDSLERLLQEPPQVAIETEDKSILPGWLQPLTRHIRFFVHQAIVFYVKRVAQRQYALNREFLKALQAQQAEIEKLRAELEQRTKQGDN